MSFPWIENSEKKDEEKSVKYGLLLGVSRKISWIYSPAVQYCYGRAWRLVKDYGRRITEAAGEEDKRCATKHAEVCSVKYVEYCKDF